MADLIITTALGGAVTYLPLAGGDSEGQYWTSYDERGTEQYERGYWSAPGINGQGVIRFGFRTRRLSVTVRYQAATESALHASVEADLWELVDTACTISVPNGDSYPACELIDGRCAPEWNSGRGTWCADVELVFEQLRLA